MDVFEQEGDKSPSADVLSPGSEGWDDERGTGETPRPSFLGAGPDELDDDDEDENQFGCFMLFIRGSASLALYFCNTMILLLSFTVVTAMVIAFKDVEEQVAEIVVMGLTLAFLGFFAILGVWGTFTKKIALLQMYAFGLILLLCAQMAIIAVLVQTMKSADSSLTNAMIGVSSVFCSYSAQLIGGAEAANATGVQGVPGATEQVTGSWLDTDWRSAYDAADGPQETLCACTDFPSFQRDCIDTFIADNEQGGLICLFVMWILEGACTLLAYVFVAMEREAEEEEEGSFKVVLVTHPDPPAFVFPDTLKDPVKLLIWIIAMMTKIHAAARKEAVLLDKTAYFESAVLFCSFTNFVVLANECKAQPPQVQLAATMKIAEIFVTLFLSFEVFLAVFVKMTQAQRKKIFRHPWVVIDIFVLAVSWAYLYDPKRIYSIGRVMRVLRPLRTLRMLSDINVVMETMIEAGPLFAQASLLVSFMLTTYSLLGMSLWAGGLRYACDAYSSLDIPDIWTDYDRSGSQATENLTAALLARMEGPVIRETESRSWFDYSYSQQTVVDPPVEMISCPACLECTETNGKCGALVQPTYIRSENFGFSGFDNFAMSMLTMFVQMTGDNGMQDIPFALENAGVSLSSAGWFTMATATAVLTTLALNLFLAVCCSVFDGVMDKIDSRQEAAYQRAKKREAQGLGLDQQPEGMLGMIGAVGGAAGSVMGMFGAIKDKAMDAVGAEGDAANEARKPDDVKYMDYEETIRKLDWNEKGSKIAGCRMACKNAVTAKWFSYMINSLIMVNAIILCSNHHGMATQWRDINMTIESSCLIVFWAEFIMKLFAFSTSIYFAETTNRLDFVVLLATSTGVIGELTEIIAETVENEHIAEVSSGLSAFNSIRLVKMMRALQMSRWIFGHPALRQILQTVFKSWQSIILIGAFSLFSMLMFATVAMNLFGGSLGTFPEVVLVDYPRRNVETFSNAFFQSCQYMTGEAWSTTMYWYMEHSDTPQWATGAFFVLMFMWLNAVLFSLFVAVLLVNFGVDEDEMMPKQRTTYELEKQRAETRQGKHQANRLKRLLKLQQHVYQAESAPKKKPRESSFSLLQDYNANHAATVMIPSSASELENGSSASELENGSSDEKGGDGTFDVANPKAGIFDDDASIELSTRLQGGKKKKKKAEAEAQAAAAAAAAAAEAEHAEAARIAAAEEEARAAAAAEEAASREQRMLRVQETIQKGKAAAERNERQQAIKTHRRTFDIDEAEEKVREKAGGTEDAPIDRDGDEEDVSDALLDTKSLNFFSTNSKVRLLCSRMESHPWFEKLVAVLVLISCFMVAFEDPATKQSDEKSLFEYFNMFLLFVFTFEAIVKSIVHGFRGTCGPTPPFLSSSTNKLDLFVIVVMMAAYVLPVEGELASMLRLARVLAPMLELVRQDSIAGLISTCYLALPAIGAVMFLLTILLAVFGIVGVEFFGGGLYRCVHARPSARCVDVSPMPLDCYPTSTGIYLETILDEGMPIGLNPSKLSHLEVHNKTMCEQRRDTELDALWMNPPFNFDNIFEALMTLFYLSTCAGWVDLMEEVVDITYIDQSPSPEFNPSFQAYFFMFHVIFGTFMLNLFIGVLGNAFSEQSGTNLITPKQVMWIRAEVMLKTYAPVEDVPDRPETGVRLWQLRQKMWDWAENPQLEQVWTIGIVVNVVVLLMDHFPSDPVFDGFVGSINFICLLVFTAEFFIKLIGYGFLEFFANPWSKLDLLVIVGSWGSMLGGMKSGAAVIRSFRTFRLALLVKRMPGLMSLVETVFACILPSLNICALSSIIFYLYAVIGMNLFGEGHVKKIGGYDNNFETFLSSLAMLFQAINGQTIYAIMWDMREFGTMTPFFYFSSFYFILVFLGMNLLVVVVLDNFSILASLDEGHFTPDDLDAFVESFVKLTHGVCYDVDPSKVQHIMDQITPDMHLKDRGKLKDLARQKVELEEDIRQQQWMEFKQRCGLPEYYPDSYFGGWLRISKQDGYFYFWIDSDANEEGADGEMCLNWFGVRHEKLHYHFLKHGRVPVNRVRIKKLKSELSDKGKALGSNPNDFDPFISPEKMNAAISGRAWLLGLIQTKENHPDNMAAKYFDKDYFDEDLAGDESAIPKLMKQLSTGGDDVAVEVDGGLGLHVTERVEEYLTDEFLTPLQLKFRQVIEVGVTIPACAKGFASVPSGCVCCEPEDYRTFWPFFSQVLEEMHCMGKFAPPDSPWSDWGDVVHEIEWRLASVAVSLTVSFKGEAAKLKGGAKSPRSQASSGNALAPQSPGAATKAEPENLADVMPASLKHNHFQMSSINTTVLPISLSVSRNVRGFTMVATMTELEREFMEDLVEKCLYSLEVKPEWAGRYVSLTPGHINQISEKEYKQLVEDGLMFPPAHTDPMLVAAGLAADWPVGRGAYISADEKTVVHVGYIDHITVLARDPECEYLDLLADRLRVSLGFIEADEQIEFIRDPELCGYVTSLPKNLGTGFQAWVDIPCPHLTMDGTTQRVQEIIDLHSLDLEIRQVPVSKWQGCSGEGTSVSEGGVVQVAVKRTYGVTEAWIVQSLYRSIARLNEFDHKEQDNREVRRKRHAKERRELQMKDVMEFWLEAEEEALEDMYKKQQENNDAKIPIIFDITEVADTPKGTKKEMKIYADTPEMADCWLVALQWLQGGCKGKAPRRHPVMGPGGIRCKPLSEGEWRSMESRPGLVDLPFSSLKHFFLAVQEKGVLSFNNAHDREYRAYSMFQLETQAYLMFDSTLAKREANMDFVMHGVDGVNMRAALHRMCLLNYGKVESLSYKQCMDDSIMEVELLSLCIIQTAVGEWVCRRLHAKYPNIHPCGNHSSWWRHHDSIYSQALRAARNTRLRSLKLLVKLARRTRPICPTLSELNDIKKGRGLTRPEDDLCADFERDQARIGKPLFGEEPEFEEGDDGALYDELLAKEDKRIAERVAAEEAERIAAELASATAAAEKPKKEKKRKIKKGRENREVEAFGDFDVQIDGPETPDKDRNKNGAGSPSSCSDQDEEMLNPLAGQAAYVPGSAEDIADL